MGSPIQYDYNAANATLAQTKAYLTNMENTISDAMTSATNFFDAMSATSKSEIQQSFSQVINTGHSALAACVAVNGATTQAVEAMSITDTGQIGRFA